MKGSYQYRLSKNQKIGIAHNLIDILGNDTGIKEETTKFIGEWILTGQEEKRKAFFDVWDIVLKNFLPKNRPILFRSCNRISKNGKIASFTGRFECVNRFSKGNGSIIICDTKENLSIEEEVHSIGTYENTFYPLVDVLIKANNEGGWNFSKGLLDKYIGEDEYIMRINLGRMHCFKWNNKD